MYTEVSGKAAAILLNRLLCSALATVSALLAIHFKSVFREKVLGHAPPPASAPIPLAQSLPLPYTVAPPPRRFADIENLDENPYPRTLQPSSSCPHHVMSSCPCGSGVPARIGLDEWGFYPKNNSQPPVGHFPDLPTCGQHAAQNPKARIQNNNWMFVSLEFLLLALRSTSTVVICCFPPEICWDQT